MSGLAEILMHKGYAVTGSDIKDSHLTRRLEDKGARYLSGITLPTFKELIW